MISQGTCAWTSLYLCRCKHTFPIASAVFTGTVLFSTMILEDVDTEAIMRAAPSQYARSAAFPAPTPDIFVGVLTLQQAKSWDDVQWVDRRALSTYRVSHPSGKARVPGFPVMCRCNRTPHEFYLMQWYRTYHIRQIDVNVSSQCLYRFAERPSKCRQHDDSCSDDFSASMVLD